ncbi:recombinase family protein [Nocardiopsis synnemataformans]|uniref:recombinase family protein n=1 Tax=Nocardiopsis synnemataformans TaxID=61305 RepID=UPI003EB84C62
METSGVHLLRRHRSSYTWGTDTALAPPDDPLAPAPTSSSGALIGYARVSTREQKLDRQFRALAAAGCAKAFADKKSGKNAQRPELKACLAYLRPGDTLVVPALAEFIRELIVEGTREGLDAARAAGKRLGRPPR